MLQRDSTLSLNVCWHCIEFVENKVNLFKKLVLVEYLYMSYILYFLFTVKAFMECSRFLLQNGVGYILSQDFCQDPLEEHFGRHRGLGYRHENPNILQFGY